MNSLAVVVAWTDGSLAAEGLEPFASCATASEFALIRTSNVAAPPGAYQAIESSDPLSANTVGKVLKWYAATGATHLLWVFSPRVDISRAGVSRLLTIAEDTGAALVYSDHFDRDQDGHVQLHPLVDYQPGSVRDDFDFGQVVLLRGEDLRALVSQWKQESVAERFGGWYELRLRLSEQSGVVHLTEPTYTVQAAADHDVHEAHFKYVDPGNREYQIEMERVMTAHLQRIGCYLSPPRSPLAEETDVHPVEASVIIPVRNRERTIADAVRSALRQEADFEFNVMVIDNHSDDQTTAILSELASNEPRLVHMIPHRTDLAIGGCWNEALYSAPCGRYAVQLDSDDLYDGTDVLTRIVAEFHDAARAMVIGSYTLVDFDLQPIPPGLVSHQEWTDENGHNNALRIAGLGAPCAFHVPTLRTIGFPNVSYGEDYAVAIQLTRRYQIGRIYDSLYCCRRWEDNTDHQLPLESRNRYAAYKDRLRTIELASRKQ